MNGHKNEWTWLTRLHCEEILYDVSENFLEAYPDQSKLEVMQPLADELKLTITELVLPDAGENLYLADLLGYVTDAIDWHELADLYYDSIREN